MRGKLSCIAPLGDIRDGTAIAKRSPRKGFGWRTANLANTSGGSVGPGITRPAFAVSPSERRPPHRWLLQDPGHLDMFQAP